MVLVHDVLDLYVDACVSKDGNGAPIPDSPWGIPLLGDGDGTNFIPTGIETVED
jgi:hypothetical protein